MFLESKDFLSIWDIAHRWAGFDPDATDPNHLPEEVAFWMHRVVLAYFSKDLVVRRKSGYRVPDEPEFVFVFNVNIWGTRLWKCADSSLKCNFD